MREQLDIFEKRSKVEVAIARGASSPLASARQSRQPNADSNG